MDEMNLDNLEEERRFLLYAQKYVQRRISSIQIDLSLNIYGEEPTKKLKEALAKWESESRAISKKIICSENNW